MLVSESFKKAISEHLEGLAANDPLFAETLKKPAKNIDDCTTYILNKVKETGQNGFADEEIFGMAVHYYDEDDIKIGDKVSGRVVVNHHIDAPAKNEKLKDNATKTEVIRHGKNMPSSITSLPTPKTKKSKPESQMPLF